MSDKQKRFAIHLSIGLLGFIIGFFVWILFVSIYWKWVDSLMTGTHMDMILCYCIPIPIVLLASSVMSLFALYLVIRYILHKTWGETLLLARFPLGMVIGTMSAFILNGILSLILTNEDDVIGYVLNFITGIPFFMER